jgi:hypothetical protein
LAPGVHRDDLPKYPPLNLTAELQNQQQRSIEDFLRAAKLLRGGETIVKTPSVTPANNSSTGVNGTYQCDGGMASNNSQSNNSNTNNERTPGR